LGSLWLATAPSQAAFATPEYQFTFAGSGDHAIGKAQSVAINQESHRVYVTDQANHRVEVFDLLGNFLFMFGDHVNKTTGGNICPASPGDECQPGQQSNGLYPNWASPKSIAVDNSNGPSRGSVYVADNVGEGGDGSVTKFDADGNLITSFGENGRRYAYPLGMTVSAYTGYVWVLDWNWQFASYDDKGTESLRFSQNWNVGDTEMAVDSNSDIYYATGNGVTLKANAKEEQEGEGEVGFPDPGRATGIYVNPGNGDVLIGFGSEVVVHDESCDPSAGYCAIEDTFGAGHLTNGRGIAVDSASGGVYIAEDGGIAYFKPKVVPDVIPTAPPAAGHTEATVFAHVDPLGAGNITECKVEYGPSKSYGSSTPCDQSLPITSASDVTVHLTGLTAEKPYHYRFVAKNGNGVSRGPDLIVTPHWVKNLLTLDPTDIGPGGATLHGTLDPNGEETHYYFEWGTTNKYGNKTPAEPGADIGSGVGDTPIELSLAGQLTSETTYHYRLVAYNALGTSKGFDKSFTTPIAELPTIQGVAVSDVGLSSVTVHAQIRPGFGNTSYMVQYGLDDTYGQRTVISPSVGDDGTFHPISEQIEELIPGTTYHYRVVAFNYKGATQGVDTTFTTADLPLITSTSAVPLGPDSARLSAQVYLNGFSGGASVHFDYGIDEGYGSRTGESPPLGASGGSQSVDVAGLAPGTTYHFRAVATNAFGTSVGRDQSFTTPPAAAAPTGPATATCKKGQVRRKGKCVKKPHRKHKHRKRHRHGARG
jgi:hypothetical protein